MNKILLLVFVVVIVLVGVFFIWPTNSEMPGPVEEQDKLVVLTDGAYGVDPVASELNWEGRKTLIPNYVDRGTVAISGGDLMVVEGAITAGEVSFDMTKIEAKTTGKESGESMLTNHLKSADFFDVVKFPTANLKMVSLTKDDAGQYQLKANLTIKNITKEISLPVVVNQTGDTLKVTGQTEIDRTLWDIKYASTKFFADLADKVIADEVGISFTLITKLK